METASYLQPQAHDFRRSILWFASALYAQIHYIGAGNAVPFRNEIFFDKRSLRFFLMKPDMDFVLRNSWECFDNFILWTERSAEFYVPWFADCWWTLIRWFHLFAWNFPWRGRPLMHVPQVSGKYRFRSRQVSVFDLFIRWRSSHFKSDRFRRFIFRNVFLAVYGKHNEFGTCLLVSLGMCACECVCQVSITSHRKIWIFIFHILSCCSRSAYLNRIVRKLWSKFNTSSHGI